MRLLNASFVQINLGLQVLRRLFISVDDGGADILVGESI